MTKITLSDAVMITKEAYDQLINSHRELSALHDGGVNNWEWYEESLREAGLYEEEEEEEEDDE
jgi:hypothetical protein